MIYHNGSQTGVHSPLWDRERFQRESERFQGAARGDLHLLYSLNYQTVSLLMFVLRESIPIVTYIYPTSGLLDSDSKRYVVGNGM